MLDLSGLLLDKICIGRPDCVTDAPTQSGWLATYKKVVEEEEKYRKEGGVVIRLFAVLLAATHAINAFTHFMHLTINATFSHGLPSMGMDDD